MYDEESRSKTQTICLIVLTTAVIGYAIYWLRPVLLPFVVAVFVVSGLAPVLEYLQRKLRVNRLVAAAITFVVGLLVVFVLGFTFRASALELNKMAPAYKSRVQEIVQSAEKLLPASLRDSPTDDEASVVRGSTNKEPGLVDSLLRSALANLSATLLHLVTTSIVVLIYVFFLMLGASATTTTSTTWMEIDQQIRGYLRLKTVISLVTGTTFGVALYLFGIPMAMTFGVLAFLLNYIPNIGPLLACLMPIPLIVLQPDAGVAWMALVILVISGIQFLSGNVIEPKIMGNSADLHPVVILLALMFWGMLWGIVGMFLATPITAGIKIVLQRIDAAKPVADLMAGRMPGQEQTAPGESYA